MRTGTTPESIQAVATVAIQMRMGMAGRIWMALRRRPTVRPRRVAIRPMALRASEMAEAVRSIQGPSPETASEPRTMMTVTRVRRRKRRGIRERVTVGLWRRPNILVLFNFADGLRMCNCFFRVAKLAIFAEIAAVKSAKRLKGVLNKGEKERPEGAGGGSFRRFFILGALGALGIFPLAAFSFRQG